MTNQAFLSDVTIDAELEAQAVNTIRMLSADGVQAAKSGHPGMPMGCLLYTSPSPRDS